MNLKLPSFFVLMFIVGLVSGVALSAVVVQYRIVNVSAIRTIGVNVYWDQNCTQDISHINWGLLEPNSSKNIMVFVKSISNIAITLGITTENWNPVNCIDYMTLTASPDNLQMQPSEIRQVSLTLTVASNIQGIVGFTFDIVFVGE